MSYQQFILGNAEDADERRVTQTNYLKNNLRNSASSAFPNS